MSVPINKELMGVFVATEGWDDVSAALEGISWSGGPLEMDIFSDIPSFTVPTEFTKVVTDSDVLIVPKWRLKIAGSLSHIAMQIHLGTEGYMTRQVFALDPDYVDRQDTDYSAIGVDPEEIK